MYSNKENVNILTALLVAYGVRHVVVCPGSRNAPLVHNFNTHPALQCYGVTDERSAGFYALGVAQATSERVAVCVTSGTALLNLAPAVAEAYYQQRPLIVISADRPPQWIDQLDGQTLPQPDALGRFVRRAVTLPEPRDDEERWYCNRLVCEALVETAGPVHINVPISEPLFDFTVDQLPRQRVIERVGQPISDQLLATIADRWQQAERPMLISGQPLNLHLDEAVWLARDDVRYVPDFVLYTGGSIVSKRAKHFLRRAGETWSVNATGEVNDTFQNLTRVIVGDGARVAAHIRQLEAAQPKPFTVLWDELLAIADRHAADYAPAYSQMAAVKYFEQQLSALYPQPSTAHVHYANSTAIRLANIYAHHPIWCNRGVNGIEGSLSTAAGFSLAASPCPSASHNDGDATFCVIGDLSFFYDQNALWNQHLRGNLRILLLNNGRGGIFNQLSMGMKTKCTM
ncbi:MAG: 2-succinyl-5-enolpyruvyl-6-hydroxy-3-cyclohexene-1-carboxylic-acid synthase [Prevotella sp.]|nr:2-succinyl-5-enolpyruvyl-6-hydroxy-3-cyclohexene-1-carboxylic-acid synthase [Prevotella sp.]